MNYWLYASPLGTIIIVSDGSRLLAAKFIDQKGAQGIITAGMTQCRDEIIDLTCRWYDIYFTGRQPGFIPPLAPLATPFARAVQHALMSIPYGTTTVYAAVAQQTEKPGAVRAAARCIAGNPYIIIVPCHRVIASDGTLRGYAATLARKHSLLMHEHRAPAI